jgi:hypothetical protein
MGQKWEDALSMAMQHARQSEARVARQRQLVTTLYGDEHNTTRAGNILGTLEALLRQHRAHLARYGRLSYTEHLAEHSPDERSRR